MEAIIREIDAKEPVSRDGLSALNRQYSELDTLEKEWKKLSEQEQLTIQNQHLIELFQIFFKHKAWLILFPQCTRHDMKKVMT